MSATKTPNQSVAILSRSHNWTQDGGEQQVKIYRGDKDSVYALYQEHLASPPAGVMSMEYTDTEGRGELRETFVRVADVYVIGSDSEITIIEEVFAVDVLKDIRTHKYFETLTDAQIALVSNDVENQTESPSYSDAKQAALYSHLIHKVESYNDVQFCYRKTSLAMKSKNINAAFDNINRVVSAPTPSAVAAINHLLASFPDGEWLYRPPQAEYTGKGKWRVTQEWWWAEKWSVIYGGTWLA